MRRYTKSLRIKAAVSGIRPRAYREAMYHTKAINQICPGDSSALDPRQIWDVRVLAAADDENVTLDLNGASEGIVAFTLPEGTLRDVCGIEAHGAGDVRLRRCAEGEVAP